MSDIEIIDGLLNHDKHITCEYFFDTLRPLFEHIKCSVPGYLDVSYDEMASELYIFLMDNDGHRLKQFGFQTSLYQWMKLVAIRFFMQKSKENYPD